MEVDAVEGVSNGPGHILNNKKTTTVPRPIDKNKLIFLPNYHLPGWTIPTATAFFDEAVLFLIKGPEWVTLMNRNEK